MTSTSMRTLRCGAVRSQHIGQVVRLGGWIHRRRDLGAIVFFDLRDRDGLLQVAFDPQWASDEVIARAGGLGSENVILVEGTVAARPEDARNPAMETGEVEIHATGLELVGPAVPPVIPVWRQKGEDLPAEELRLEHRALDLRRPELQANLRLRHELLQVSRRTLSGLGFLEIETPILTTPTPEGARDYLVPSRVHPGQFYSLPQSPQIYKQILMGCGFDRYFQLARCFRDEDLRADRQPEFTQIDLEASFVDADDVYGVVEEVAVNLWKVGGHEMTAPFERMTFAEAMDRFGSDRPDVRFGYELEDMGALFGGRGFAAFDSALEAGGRVRGIRVPGGAVLSRKETDRLTELVREQGLGGLALLKRRGDELFGPLARLDGMEVSAASIDDGGLFLVVAGPDAVTSPALAKVRTALIERMQPAPNVEHAFLWVDGFPLFEPDAEHGGWTFAHHPFTAPAIEDLDRFRSGDVEQVRAQHYDLVYNGNELGSGSIRIADPELQLSVLAHLGIDGSRAERLFGWLLNTLRAGVPPHGGMALGFDRMVMLLAGASSLRDVIAFPKSTAARALFEGSPAELGNEDLAIFGLRKVT